MLTTNLDSIFSSPTCLPLFLQDQYLSPYYSMADTFFTAPNSYEKLQAIVVLCKVVVMFNKKIQKLSLTAKTDDKTYKGDVVEVLLCHILANSIAKQKLFTYYR
jgi:hypothetical protein